MSVGYVRMMETTEGNKMISLETLGIIFANGYTIVDSPAAVIECAHVRSERYYAFNWDLLAALANENVLCDCGWHKNNP